MLLPVMGDFPDITRAPRPEDMIGLALTAAREGRAALEDGAR